MIWILLINKEANYEASIYALTKKVEELESKLHSKDLEIKRVKMQNQKLSGEKSIIEAKLK